jgi:DEAD/DEAH box helicase domain-containing protein
MIESYIMDRIDSALEALEKDSAFLPCVAHWERLPPRTAEYASLPEGLDPRLQQALHENGIEKLYTHQKSSYEHVRKKKNIVIVTPTASGKTLCYNLPTLQLLLEDTQARALYLFPTKALSQDQQAELNTLIEYGELPVKVNTYDGDTPSSIRVAARNSGRIVISNPDMLHTGILPNHPKWISFISSLKLIVIDEVHMYRGVFGSHMTNVIRRLKRIAQFYGSNPTFICCSATIGNPRELAEHIIEEEAVLVDNNGAPSGEKHVILYNPPLVDKVQGIRRGVVLESQKIALKLLKSGIKTIVFARSRVRTELIASYINKALANVYTDNSRIRVESYRGGYLPSERRSIEKGLRDGSVQGVVSTNALELGIDIGGLDSSILAGLPGSIASAWQQAGRAGRSTSKSLSIMMASASPADQYMVNHPEYFFGQSPESAWIDPDNIYILMDHLKCAVFELPFKDGEYFGGPVQELLAYLEENGVVRHTEATWYWQDRSYPAESISLRSASSENVIIIDVTQGKYTVIGETDRPSAKELLYEGAVYIHRGEQYMVKELDLENGRCYVEVSEVNFYTDAIVKSDIKVLEEDNRFHTLSIEVVVGDVLVRSQAAKYKKLKYNTHENVGYGDIHLPEEEIHTRSTILLFNEESQVGMHFRELPEMTRELVIGKLGTLIKNVAPLFLLCDARDIGVAERLRDPHFEISCLYVYDMYPGGTGLSEGFIRKLDQIIPACRELVAQCGCTRGCPSCIGPEAPSYYQETGVVPENPKDAVKSFLDTWIEG